jgi:hypothetical protein
MLNILNLSHVFRPLGGHEVKLLHHLKLHHGLLHHLKLRRGLLHHLKLHRGMLHHLKLHHGLLHHLMFLGSLPLVKNLLSQEDHQVQAILI